jgi:transcription elongation factor Elf1
MLLYHWKLDGVRSKLIATDSALFICPKCGESTLSIHRKTYERIVIIFCDNCRLHTAFEPSLDAYFDLAKCCQEFSTQYKQIGALKKPC